MAHQGQAEEGSLLLADGVVGQEFVEVRCRQLGPGGGGGGEQGEFGAEGFEVSHGAMVPPIGKGEGEGCCVKIVGRGQVPVDFALRRRRSPASSLSKSCVPCAKAIEVRLKNQPKMES